MWQILSPPPVFDMENELKIGNWNLCLGLPNKKDLVTDVLRNNGINICCLQETEIPLGFPEKALNCGGINLN